MKHMIIFSLWALWLKQPVFSVQKPYTQTAFQVFGSLWIAMMLLWLVLNTWFPAGFASCPANAAPFTKPSDIGDAEVVRYANLFDIKYHETYKVIQYNPTLAKYQNSWQDPSMRGQKIRDIVLYQCGTTPPTSSFNDVPEDALFFSVPVEKVALGWGGTLHFWELLSVTQSISNHWYVVHHLALYSVAWGVYSRYPWEDCILWLLEWRLEQCNKRGRGDFLILLRGGKHQQQQQGCGLGCVTGFGTDGKSGMDPFCSNLLQFGEGSGPDFFQHWKWLDVIFDVWFLTDFVFFWIWKPPPQPQQQQQQQQPLLLLLLLLLTHHDHHQQQVFLLLHTSTIFYYYFY